MALPTVAFPPVEPVIGSRAAPHDVVGAAVTADVVAELLPICRRLSHAQPTLTPDDAGQLLHQVLFSWPLWCVFSHQGVDERAVLGLVLPWQNGVAA